MISNKSLKTKLFTQLCQLKISPAQAVDIDSLQLALTPSIDN
jgi:hypothetical protein